MVELASGSNGEVHQVQIQVLEIELCECLLETLLAFRMSPLSTFIIDLKERKAVPVIP